MIKKVKWRARAIADIERLHDFLESKNINAAAHAAKTILEGGDLIATSPFIGRPMPDGTGRRELFVSFGAGAYVLRYRLDDDEMPVIIRVWHSLESRNN